MSRLCQNTVSPDIKVEGSLSVHSFTGRKIFYLVFRFHPGVVQLHKCRDKNYCRKDFRSHTELRWSSDSSGRGNAILNLDDKSKGDTMEVIDLQIASPHQNNYGGQHEGIQVQKL